MMLLVPSPPTAFGNFAKRVLNLEPLLRHLPQQPSPRQRAHSCEPHTLETTKGPILQQQQLRRCSLRSPGKGLSQPPALDESTPGRLPRGHDRRRRAPEEGERHEGAGQEHVLRGTSAVSTASAPRTGQARMPHPAVQTQPQS